MWTTPMPAILHGSESRKPGERPPAAAVGRPDAAAGCNSWPQLQQLLRTRMGWAHTRSPWPPLAVLLLGQNEARQGLEFRPNIAPVEEVGPRCAKHVDSIAELRHGALDESEGGHDRPQRGRHPDPVLAQERDHACEVLADAGLAVLLVARKHLPPDVLLAHESPGEKQIADLPLERLQISPITE